MSELSALAGSEGYVACDDAAARAESSKKWQSHFFDTLKNTVKNNNERQHRHVSKG